MCFGGLLFSLFLLNSSRILFLRLYFEAVTCLLTLYELNFIKTF